MRQNVLLQNFAYGETSPFVRGRSDTKLYVNSCRKLENFLPLITGALEYRPGLRFSSRSSRGRVARLEPFIVSEDLAFILEFTHQRLRILQAGGEAYTAPTKNISNITFTGGGATTTVTSNSHGLIEGQRILLTGIVGTTELNGKYYEATDVTTNTFTLKDLRGAYVPSTGLTAYASGGVITPDYELAVRYREEDIFRVQIAKAGTLAVLTHLYYDLQQLVFDPVARTWVVGAPTLTNDPFTASDDSATLTKAAKTILVTSVDFSTVTNVQLEDVGSTTPTGDEDWEALSGTRYLVEATATPGQWYLKNFDGTYLDTSGYSTHASVLARAVPLDKPAACAFYENRLVFGGTYSRPATVFMSMAPDPTTGATRYLDFTGGTDATDALFFTLSPVNGRWDAIRWLSAGLTQLLVGCFGGVFRVTGGGTEEPITPSSINAKPSDAFGCSEASAQAVGRQTYFIQRGGLIVRGYSYEIDAYEAAIFDTTLQAEHITESGLKQLAYQAGRPDILWAVREDGVLLSASINLAENVIAWARHTIGGGGKAVSVAVVPNAGSDEVWVVVEREISGITQRFLEILTERTVFPDREDFHTGSPDADDLAYRNTLYQRQKNYTHLDGFSTFDGSARGVAAGATLTPAAVSGASVVFTASAAVFTAADVGNELRINTELGTGIARITAYTDTTHVTCAILSAFPGTTAIPAGSWYLTASTLSGLDHLEGAEVSVVADGAYLPDSYTVTDGAITLPYEAAVAHVGWCYEGRVQTQNIAMTGVTGPADTVHKSIVEIRPRFLYTIGGEYGASPYSLERVYSLDTGGIVGRPPAPFSGIRKLPVTGSWNFDAQDTCVYFRQQYPLPCTILFMDIIAEVLSA